MKGLNELSAAYDRGGTGAILHTVASQVSTATAVEVVQRLAGKEKASMYDCMSKLARVGNGGGQVVENLDAHYDKSRK